MLGDRSEDIIKDKSEGEVKNFYRGEEANQTIKKIIEIHKKGQE